MRVAIYTRFSSDKQRQASTDDQRRKCETRAAAEGWDVAAHFADEAMSGSRSDRPGYQAMLAAAMAGTFEGIVVESLDRMSRDSVESEQTVRRLEHRGVRVVGIADGYDSTSGKGRKLMRGVRGLLNEVYLDDLREKTHRGLEGQAIKGNNAGGRTYGYRHVAVEDPTRVDSLGRAVVTAVRKEIDEAQAIIVRRIFAMYADGKSARAIAEILNSEGVASPGATWNRARESQGWAATAISGPMAGTGILNNELYIGRYIWNRRQWVRDPDDAKKRTPRERPQSEWTVTEMPELRIVDAALWERVKARQREQAANIGARVRAGLARRSAKSTGRPAKYLLSGLLRCGVCGGNFVISGKDRYRCASRTNGRSHLCTNTLTVSRRLVESKLLEGVKRDLLSPDVIADVVKRVRAAVADAARAPNPNTAKIATLRLEIGRLVDAVANGLLAPSIAVRTRQERAEAELASLESRNAAPVAKVEKLLPKIADSYRTLIDNIGESVQRDIARARADLRRVLGDAIRLLPSESGDYLEAEVALAGERLIRLAANSLNNNEKYNVVAGAGFEPATFGL